MRPMRKRKRIDNWFVLLVVGVLIAVVSIEVNGQVSSKKAIVPSVWLPVIAKANTNPVHSGIATFYGATGAGACLFDPTPNDLMVAAMNAAQFDTASFCGAHVRVTGPQGTITMRIVDLCPECETGHLDLSAEAFAQIAEPIQGIVDIEWQVVSPALEGPVAYRFKEGSNQWWTAVQLRNHRNPIATVEYLNENGQWINVPRTAYNYFVQTNPGMGPGPYTFRVTDWYGNVLTDDNIPHMEAGTVQGIAQFPFGP